MHSFSRAFAVKSKVMKLLPAILVILSGIHAAFAQAPALPEKQSTQIFGQTIRYFDIGQGPVIVLLHGLGSRADLDWGQVLLPLSQHHRVLAMDQVGFGSSAKPMIDYRIQTWVDFLGEFLRQQKVEHFVLAGESLGGWIAAQYTIQSLSPTNSGALRLPPPEKVILTDAAGLPVEFDESTKAGLEPASIEDMRVSLQHVFYNPEFSNDVSVRHAFEGKLAAGDGYTVHTILQNVLHSGEYVEKKLAAITVPVLVVWGENDRLLPLANGKEYASRIPRARLVIIPQCGHVPAVEKTQEYLAAVNSFID